MTIEQIERKYQAAVTSYQKGGPHRKVIYYRSLLNDYRRKHPEYDARYFQIVFGI